MELQEIKQIGSKIKDFRKGLDLTLPELSLKTGLSASYLSRIERGMSSPSLESLTVLAKAFGHGLSAFFGSEAKSQLDTKNTYVTSGDVTVRLLTDFFSGNPKVKIALCNLEAKTSFPKKHTHQGEEVVYVLDGQAEIELRNEKYTLPKGESFGFKGTTPHNISNPLNSPARLLIATVTQKQLLIKRD